LQAAPLPQWSKDQPFKSGNWGGSADVVTKQSKHPKAATLFVIWLNAHKGPVVSNWNKFSAFFLHRFSSPVASAHVAARASGPGHASSRRSICNANCDGERQENPIP